MIAVSVRVERELHNQSERYRISGMTIDRKEVFLKTADLEVKNLL